jgi:type IV pilus assembly protein PilC
MPLFRYQAIDTTGNNITGTMIAPDEPALESRLKDIGCWLVDASAEKQSPTVDKAAKSQRGWLSWWGQFRRREVIDFCTLMAFQTKVGVPLVQALEVAGMECENPRFQEVLLGVRRHLEGGLLFWEALEKYPRVFTPHFIAVVRAGEQSSNLPETFRDMKAHLEWVEQMIGDVRQASLYPLIVLTVVSGFVLFLFTNIIPKFSALLASVKVPLPLITVIIFGVSDLIQKTWWAWLPLLLFLTLGVQIGRRVSKRFARVTDRMKLKLPILGELNQMLAVSRFAQNLAILYRSGLPILQSLNLCRGLVGNVVVEDAVASVEENVKAGATISEAIRRQAVFPAMLLRMVIMGETTGNLDSALQNVSDYYNQVIPRRLKKIFTILEPALIVFLVFTVGAVALSIFLPILSLMDHIK